MKKIKNLIVIAFVALISSFVVACQPTGPEAQEVVTEAAKKITISGDLQAVTEDLELDSSLSFDYEGKNYSISLSWESKNTAVLGHDGKVTQAATDTDVELVATATYEGKTATKKFDVKVLAIPVDKDKLIAESAAKAVVIDGITLDSVIADFTLPTSISHSYEGTAYTVSLSWNSDKANIAVSGANATVTRPEFGEGNASVGLTVTATYEGKTGTHKLNLTVLEKEDERPILTGKVYHWMIGAKLADVTADLDLNGADESTLKVFFGTDELEIMDEFDYNDGAFSIKGKYLDESLTENKTYTFKVETSLGFSNFDVIVVADPRGTSIPTETIKDIDMSGVAAVTNNSVITNAPELLITEIYANSGNYDYIEVYNNTDSEYNLKNHRLAFADSSQLEGRAENHAKGIFDLPLNSGSSGVWIYEDMKIPAFGKALVWVLKSLNVFEQATADPRIVTTIDESQILGSQPNNLNIAKFKAYHGLGESDLVFSVRPQAVPMRNDYGYDSQIGLGVPLRRPGWGGFSVKYPRAVQIQKYNVVPNVETAHTLTATDLANSTFEIPSGRYAKAPEGSTRYAYQIGVLNDERDLFPNGVLPQKINLTFNSKEYECYDIPFIGGTGVNGSGTKRQAVNAYYMRVAFYDNAGVFKGYLTESSTEAIDAYTVTGASAKAEYYTMINETASPIVIASLYPKIIEGVADVWGERRSLEYTIPAYNATPANLFENQMMRFVPRETEYKAAFAIIANGYATKDMLIGSIVTPVIEDALLVDMVVPTNKAYPRDYLTAEYNSASKVVWFNFSTVKPS